MQTIYIDISNKSVLPTIYAKQGDVGRKFRVVFSESGLKYKIPADALFSVWYNGDSGEGNYTHIGEKSAFLISDNTLDVEMIEQMLSVPGNGVLSISLADSDRQIGTWNIEYICEYQPGFESEEATEHYTAFSKTVEDLVSVSKTFTVDKTLSRNGFPAEAAETGKRISDVNNRISTEKRELKAEISVERSRIDTLSSLKDGSTTGDAELIDIRVGEDGKTYSSAGNAVREQIREVKNFGIEGLYAKSPDTNMVDFITTDGAIYQETGLDANSDDINYSYIRSGFIPVGAGEIIRYDSMVCPINFAPVVVYDKNKTLVSRVKGQGIEKKLSGTLKMPQDGFVRLCIKRSEKDYARVDLITQKKELNILVLGNSFSQDAFAYLPPVLNEILPDYNITYGVAYRDSADVMDHVKLYNHEIGTPNVEPADGKYTWFNYWDISSQSWTRYSDATSSMNGKSLTDIMALKKWGVIYVQPATGVSSDPDTHETQVNENIINPGRELLRILQDLHGGQFALLMGQWLATSSGGDKGEKVFARLVSAMQKTKQRLGIYDYIPIGTAIQNARTNETLQALGENGNMLYDTHMQSGIPALIATYTIALKILDYVGEAKRGIYGSTFFPTTENCIAINAYKADGMTKPLPMTHGDSVGVDIENVKLSQEYAVLAVNNPTKISDGTHSESNSESGGGTGKDGASAYDIAVEHGFEGTEKEWLESLKGEDGETPVFEKNHELKFADVKLHGEVVCRIFDGYSPVKGLDYWTLEEKEAMVADVIAALPVYNGEVV